MASRKSQGKSKGKGPAPKAPRPTAPNELMEPRPAAPSKPTDNADSDPVNAATLDRLAQTESQLGAEGVG